MEDTTPGPERTRAGTRRKILMIVFVGVGVAEIILAVDNGAGHRWGSMAASFLIAISAACGLLAQHQRGKQPGG